MDMERLAYEVKAELEDHFAVCKAEETRRFGTTSKYRLSVKIDGNRIMVLIGGTPSDEVVSAYGKTRQHMGRTIQSRFWLRQFEYRYDPATGVLSFHRQNEHGWTKDSMAMVGERANMWSYRRINSMALHATGRIPFPSAAATDAVNAEKSVENRARQAVTA